jgi:2-polyprenyl-6-methoxyphenol hydroxylase-like FAD-dependent oxidoreductase
LNPVAFDVAIIGGGTMGFTSALRFVDAGMSVAVKDRSSAQPREVLESWQESSPAVKAS